MHYHDRLTRLRQSLASIPCEALLIEHPTDLYYLTGLELSSGMLLVSPQLSDLIVDGRYLEYCSKQILYRVIASKKKTLKELLLNNHIHQLGFDKIHTNYQTFLNLSQQASELKELSFSLEIIPLDSLVQKLRLIKDEEEIILLKNAALLGFQGFEHITSLLREGVTEAELAFELEFFWKKKGASQLAFNSIIAFGANSSMPHYRAGSTKLESDTSVLIDIGVVLSHYCSDMTRVLFFGKPHPRIQEIYSIVEEAKKKALELCRPGTLIGELDQIARHYIASKGYGDHFIHSLGHGIGLDIHEPPILRETGSDSSVPLQKGMVFTIEPGIYLPEIGGVRLEDTIMITENGYEILDFFQNWKFN